MVLGRGTRTKYRTLRNLKASSKICFTNFNTTRLEKFLNLILITTRYTRC